MTALDKALAASKSIFRSSAQVELDELRGEGGRSSFLDEIERLRSRLTAAEQERDDWQETAQIHTLTINSLVQKVEAAFKGNARLREALREIAALRPDASDSPALRTEINLMASIARRALTRTARTALEKEKPLKHNEHHAPYGYSSSCPRCLDQRWRNQ